MLYWNGAAYEVNESRLDMHRMSLPVRQGNANAADIAGSPWARLQVADTPHQALGW